MFVYFQPLQIKSVIAKEGLRGYIYIEAFKQTHVKQIIEDVGNLRIGRWAQMVRKPCVHVVIIIIANVYEI